MSYLTKPKGASKGLRRSQALGLHRSYLDKKNQQFSQKEYVLLLKLEANPQYILFREKKKFCGYKQWKFVCIVFLNQLNNSFSVTNASFKHFLKQIT